MRYKNVKKGFTLIELLVSATLFTVLVALISGAFVVVLRSQRQAIGLVNAQGNAAVVMEGIVKEIRTGRLFSVSGSSVSGLPGANGTSLQFTNSKNEIIILALNGTRISRQVNSGSAEFISAGNVSVTGLRFVLQGAGLGDGIQPLITVIASYQALGSSPEQNINISVQTSISQRELEL